MPIEKMGPKAFLVTKKYDALKEKNQGTVDYVKQSSTSSKRSFNVTLSKASEKKSADAFERKQDNIKSQAENDLKKIDDKFKKGVSLANSEYEGEMKKIKKEYERGQKEVQKKYERDAFKLRTNTKHVVT